MSSPAPHPPPLVLVFLKAPREGWVKTRLAADIGAESATRVYRLLAERQLAAVPAGWPVEVWFAPADARDEMRAWLGPRPVLQPQPEGDLGQRLSRAVDVAFAGGAPAVLVIGGDCPELDEATLREAAAALADGRELVLGPATDGGYYLIGLTRTMPRLFAGIPWSTADVLAATLRRASEYGVVTALLSAKDDVDTVDDLGRHSITLLGKGFIPGLPVLPTT
ncbi:MAG: TIGR04282 family arsenosugar biosynthesis glycosyltransferase [Burkholderiales bacterium]|nr:TIGR04282 family arsenosugar biosynthesis glycosyltransferase [Opitutaceae bacterium]